MLNMSSLCLSALMPEGVDGRIAGLLVMLGNSRIFGPRRGVLAME
jgi:hypothetical protein